MRFKPLLLALAVALTVAHSQTKLPRGAIDGKANPQAIPNDTAVRLVLGGLAARPEVGKSGKSPAAVKAPISGVKTEKQKAVLAKIGLTVADENALLRTVEEFDASSNASARAKGPVKLDSVGAAASSSLVVRMSPAGYRAFLNYVEKEKTHMVVTPLPDMVHGK